MAGTSGLPLAGVEAIVEGLSSFESDVRSMNRALDSIQPRSTMLQRGFQSLTEGIIGFGKGLLDWGVQGLVSFGEHIIHVAEYALGQLLSDAIEWVITKIKELISAIIEAGNQFQTLEIRLNGLNLQDAIDSGLGYEEAMKKAVQVTQEQLDWLQQLGAATPFDPAQIANVYTLARSYGFADAEARRLTEDITSYTAGMGLSNEVLERVIQNLGQMVQRGKITSTEIRDLARGAYLPLADVLDRVAKSMGITVQELSKKISEPGGGVPAQKFIEAFEQMVEEEPRFVGAAGRLARALVPAINNVKELFTSLGGRNILTPVFDVLGEKIASITDQFVKFNEQGDIVHTEKWDKLFNAAQRLGTALADVVKKLLGLAPSADSLADSLVNAVSRAADWVEMHKQDIIDFFTRVYNAALNVWGIIQRVFETLKKSILEFQTSGFSVNFLEALGFKPETAEKIVGFVNGIINTLNTVFKWVQDNGPLIKEFFSALGYIGSEVFKGILDFIGAKVEGGGILDAITAFMKFVIENKEKIADWLELIAKAIIIWQIIATVWNIVIGILIKLAGFVIGLVALWTGFNAVVAALAPILSALAPVLLVISTAILIVKTYLGVLKLAWAESVAAWQAAIATIKVGMDRLKANFFEMVNNIRTAFLNGDWVGIGIAIIVGLAKGIALYLGTLLSAVGNAMIAAYNAARQVLGISSPSTLFADLGYFIMEGMAQGISNGLGMVLTTIQNAVGTALDYANQAMSIISQNFSMGWAYGIQSAGTVGEKAATRVVQQTANAVKRGAKMRSPSKLFEGLGMLTMEGFAQGIERAAGLAVGAMQNAVGMVAMPAVSSMAVARATGNTINNNHSANLTINTSAPTEPIIQDFNMMSSLMGA